MTTRPASRVDAAWWELEHGSLAGFPVARHPGCVYVAHDCAAWQDTVARLADSPVATVSSRVFHMLATPNLDTDAALHGQCRYPQARLKCAGPAVGEP